jgi:hypothetical protein
MGTCRSVAMIEAAPHPPCSRLKSSAAQHPVMGTHLCDAALHDEEVGVVDVELHRVEQGLNPPAAGY